jgi:GT2 family glycosyltransferase
VTSADALVDVVVVTWNTREVTLRSLTNLMGGDSQTPVRVLVHDNASTDGTADAIAAAFPQVALERGTTNLGFAGGVNAALARSSAPWVLLLNSDAWPGPEAIRAMLACAERHPRAAAVAPRLVRPDGTLEHSTWPQRYIWPHDVERDVGWAVGAAWLVRREALEDIGPLDAELFMYAEDIDWCWRARERGWEIWFTPDAVVTHLGNASGEQRFGEARAAAWINNSVRVFRRRHSVPLSVGWQAVYAAGALRSGRRARRRGDVALARNWRAQAAAWLRRPTDDAGRAPT